MAERGADMCFLRFKAADGRFDATVTLILMHEPDQILTRRTRRIVRHAPDRLRAHGVPEELLHRVRLLGLNIPARWDDPHWRYGHRADVRPR